MSTPRAAAVGAVLATCAALAGPALAQLPSYGVGRPPTPEEIKAWDIAVGPDRTCGPGPRHRRTGRTRDVTATEHREGGTG